MNEPVRIAVVGAGNVGATFAYSVVLSGLASEIVLLDADKARAEGHAMDLDHAVPFNQPVRVWAGSYEDCKGALVTMVSAGASQRPGEDRMDLLKRNIAVFREVISEIAAVNPEGIILVATNPVDVLTYAAHKISGLSRRRVFGSGTILDTARFRTLLANHFDVDPRSLHAHIIGEHGDSEVPVWSLANIAGVRLADLGGEGWPKYESKAMEEIFRKTRDAAYHIIERKGATYYAVASGLLRIVEAIVRDQSTVLSASSLLTGQYGLSNVCLSLPTVINRRGVARVLELDLDGSEREKLTRSAEILSASIAELGLY
ncbi:MAG TPA: L-lactate dehydrogenase [Polyangia bacterium]|jgi:L-lactate dehydrogenase